MQLQNKIKNNKGFTLIEIIVATTILGASLVTIIGLFSGALRQATISNDYSNALFLAKMKLSEIELSENYKNHSGNFAYEGFKQYKWELTVTGFKAVNREYGKIKPQVINARIKISWKYGGKEKKVELHTIKTLL